MLLNEFYEFTYNDWLGKFFKERDVRELGCLPIDIFKELIECSIRSEDISFIQEESLKETLKTLS
ncbi:protein of unknown function [Nitrospina watsonii]|uniref:Uncharacterized protein n=1 Tax=Nitrospina watsonii TaxID=1323948 RepID=A0ABM9HI61_9BACT|nr:protein of unknown function [Nitrospina watsonii]